jgi:hypothetical protein
MKLPRRFAPMVNAENSPLSMKCSSVNREDGNVAPVTSRRRGEVQ